MTRITAGHWLFGAPFAHRGLHNETGAPENTLAAFSLAIERDYGIELDVQLSADGVVVAFHDEELARLTDGNGAVNQTAFAVLQTLSIMGTAQTIPSLAQVLELIDGQVPVLVEIKGLQGGSSALDAAVAKELEVYQGAFAVMAFNPHRLAWFARNRPEMLRGQLTERYLEDQLSWWRKFAYSHCLYNIISKPDFISYEIDMLPTWRLKHFRAKKMPIICWTINSAARLVSARKYADNLIFERIQLD